MSCRQPTPKKVQWVARHLFVTKLLEYIVSIKIIFFLAEKDRGRQRNVIFAPLTFLLPPSPFSGADSVTLVPAFSGNHVLKNQELGSRDQGSTSRTGAVAVSAVPVSRPDSKTRDRSGNAGNWSETPETARFPVPGLHREITSRREVKPWFTVVGFSRLSCSKLCHAQRGLSP